MNNQKQNPKNLQKSPKKISQKRPRPPFPTNVTGKGVGR